MSTELERQLRRTFTRLPKPGRDVSQRARSAALAALGPPAKTSRGWFVVLAFAVAFVLGAGAVALAASGKLHVDIGAQKPAKPVSTRLSIPRGTHGLAVVAGGRLWLATERGLRIEGLPVTTAELSPHALYAVVGIGSSLVTLAPGNRRPWVHPTGGRVASASWSPDGLKIAYVVARRGGDELRMIEGDGAPDRLLARPVEAAKPSWRPDSLAVAYVDARGRPAVYDFGTDTRRTFDTQSCSGAARIVAYAPRGARLAVAGAHGLAVVERWNRQPACMRAEQAISTTGLAWLSGNLFATSDNGVVGIADSALRAYEMSATDRLGAGGALFTHRWLSAVAASPAAGGLIVVLRPTRATVELVELPQVTSATRKLPVERPLLRLRTPASAVILSWR